jgi:hypothetical protein
VVTTGEVLMESLIQAVAVAVATLAQLAEMVALAQSS